MSGSLPLSLPPLSTASPHSSLPPPADPYELVAAAQLRHLQCLYISRQQLGPAWQRRLAEDARCTVVEASSGLDSIVEGMVFAHV